MSNTVHPALARHELSDDAIAWIVLKLKPQRHQITAIKERGLSRISAADLKHLWGYIKECPTVKTRLSKKARKAVFAEHVGIALRDPTVVAYLTGGNPRQSRTNTTPAAASLPPVSATVPPNLAATQMMGYITPCGQHGNLHPGIRLNGLNAGLNVPMAFLPTNTIGNVAFAPAAVQMFPFPNGLAATSPNFYHQHQQQATSFNPMGQNVTPAHRVAPSRSSQQRGGALSSSAAQQKASAKPPATSPVRVKTEPLSEICGNQSATASATQGADDYDTRPQTLREMEMMRQLQQMGFTDKREMLGGIRHVIRQRQNAQVDEAMMWIVSQREEAEEAKKMDRVRAESERLRQEVAKQKAAAKKERIENASLREWKTQSDLFMESVVLQYLDEGWAEQLRSKHKKVLVTFLELEKKALKWYGKVLPWCYLKEKAQKWDGQPSHNKCSELISKTTKDMERAMYALSEQEGGVPKIFNKAQAHAQLKGWPTGPKSQAQPASDDDDVVEVVSPPSDGQSRSSNQRGERREIVEIL